MGKLDFYVEFDFGDQDPSPSFEREARERLFDLAAGHRDLTGAAVGLEKLIKAETAYLYQVRIVVYKRPENLAAVEKGKEPHFALHQALDDIERLVKESRSKRSEAGQRTNDDMKRIVGLRAQEIYGAYTNREDPAHWLELGRTDIANRLMVDHDLSEKAAYFAADNILQIAQEKTESEHG